MMWWSGATGNTEKTVSWKVVAGRDAVRPVFWKGMTVESHGSAV
jgi:hypothetical protein